MTTPTRHPLVERYLDDLRTAAQRLPGDLQREVIDEITGHVDAGIVPGAGEAEVRNALEALGDPTDIVAGYDAAGYDAVGYDAGDTKAPQRTMAPPPMPVPPMVAPPAPSSSTAGIVGLVFGIVAVVLIALPGLGIPFAIAAIVLGVSGRRAQRRMAASTSIPTVAIVFGVLGLIAPVAVAGAFFSVRTSSGEVHVDMDESVVVPPTTTVGK